MQVNREAVKAQRGVRGYSQGELAKHAGVSRWTIDTIETGRNNRRPRLSTLRSLADALGCSIADIAIGENDSEHRALAQERTDVSA